MLNLIKNFFTDEEGGADQLIIAAILILVGIAIAVFFGEAISEMVGGLIDKMKGGVTDDNLNFTPTTTQP